ncbi:MAG TPA: hypothetical protein VEW03_13675 [Longimicrobiaceae bacterium]|nr:hypothetical protein [Longimicrobiaceae bacterium]
MQLDLTRDEAEALHAALLSYLGELQSEIAHTDDYDLRQELQRRREMLEAILARLSNS